VNKPTKRKITPQNVRAKSDSARLFDSTPKKPPTYQKPMGIPNPKPSSKGGIAGKVFKGIIGIFAFFISLILKSKVATIISLVLVVAAIGGIIDFSLNHSKIYKGISVGELNLGGMTVQEAQSEIEKVYGPVFADAKVFVFANEEAKKNVAAALLTTEEANSSEEMSIQEVRKKKLIWQVTPDSLMTTLDSEAIAQKAYESGRGLSKIFTRIKSFIFGHSVKPDANYNEEVLEALIKDIDMTIGNPRVNFDILITEGVAQVTEGHDGYMINREDFKKQLNQVLFTLDNNIASEENPVGFVAETEYAPLQIDKETAQKTCDQVNEAISWGAIFVTDTLSWTAYAKDLGEWVKTAVEPSGKTWVLRPYFDTSSAKSILLEHLKANYEGGSARISFEKTTEEITVHLENEGTIPLSEEGVKALSEHLFGEKKEVGKTPTVTVGLTAIPDKLSFEEALEYGVIAAISEFTTEYSAAAESRNTNIHLAADRLSNSIVKAEGGIWSFHETAGECNEAAGFQNAGTVIDGEIVDGIAGGICQVATTVFNAVYDSGYEITRRHNHSMYLASYPAGRDAAVNWPDLDLRWENDTDSDVLLVMTYTDTTVTATLYGVSPHYLVTTETGEWEEGEKFTSKEVEDETMSPGSSKITTQGVDGKSIMVRRVVSDKDGNYLRENNFVSNYDPKNEIVTRGPKTPEEKNDD